jgi:hypothetical protein
MSSSPARSSRPQPPALAGLEPPFVFVRRSSRFLRPQSGMHRGVALRMGRWGVRWGGRAQDARFGRSNRGHKTSYSNSAQANRPWDAPSLKWSSHQYGQIGPVVPKRNSSLTPLYSVERHRSQDLLLDLFCIPCGVLFMFLINDLLGSSALLPNGNAFKKRPKEGSGRLWLPRPGMV